MSKVCADESTVASSHTCDERFSSGFLEMRDYCRLLFCKNIYDRSEGRQWKMKKKMKNNKKERGWNAKSVSVRKLKMSSIILRSFKTRNAIFLEIMTRLSQPIRPLRFLKYGGRSFKMKISSVYNKSEIPIYKPFV